MLYYSNRAFLQIAEYIVAKSPLPISLISLMVSIQLLYLIINLKLHFINSFLNYLILYGLHHIFVFFTTSCIVILVVLKDIVLNLKFRKFFLNKNFGLR